MSFLPHSEDDKTTERESTPTSRTQHGGAEGSPRGHRPEIAHGKHCTELRTRVHAPCERDEAEHGPPSVRSTAPTRFPGFRFQMPLLGRLREELYHQCCLSLESLELVPHTKFKSSSPLITSEGGDCLLQFFSFCQTYTHTSSRLKKKGAN